MSAPTTAVQPVERQDIHKSCRTIETLLATLNDYCEAASAFTAVQKKLSKALKDAAALKTNAQSAANALGATSSILEILAEVDSKFAKILEKESSSVSSEVRKWFKKLAKEEKAHDERMNDSNTRIKQAGQAYEKKSKKGAKDTGEEHARYINLLSVIGPEMSREKYNYAVHVTQQNTSVMFNVAATLARVADAEWTRTCECMRRISPTIGSLGEWRSLCEGAWTGPLPDDLPEVSSEILAQASAAQAISEWGQTGLSTPLRRSLPVPPVTGHSPGSVSTSTTTSLDPPRSPFSTAGQNQGSVNSITTLSAFPFPPTHFPVPLAVNEAEFQRQQIQLRGLQSAHSRAGSPNPVQSHGALAPPAPILTDSPKRMAAVDLPESHTTEPSRSSHSPQMFQNLSTSHQHPTDVLPRVETSPAGRGVISPIASGEPKKPRRPSLIARVPPPSDKFTRPVSPFKRVGNVSAEKEFGLHTDGTQSVFKSHTIDAAKKHIERADSARSTGSHVAALRSKYTRATETPSQTPKDVPRLPMSVVEIASRYLPLEEPMSPRQAASTIIDRVSPDIPTHVPARDVPIDENEVRRQRQRIEELVELEFKEKELLQQERELPQRTRDFERDRLQFIHSCPPDPNTTAADGPKGPRTSAFQHKRGSRSVTHLNLPSTSSSSLSSSSVIQARLSTSHSTTPTPLMRSPVLPQKDHAPFCGCDTCSVSKYKATDTVPSPRDLRPPEPPIVLRPERPKGWIRRLSMPSVNVAFSLDAKRNASALSLKAGLPLPGENGRLRKRSFEQGISNRTVMGISR